MSSMAAVLHSSAAPGGILRTNSSLGASCCVTSSERCGSGVLRMQSTIAEAKPVVGAENGRGISHGSGRGISPALCWNQFLPGSRFVCRVRVNSKPQNPNLCAEQRSWRWRGLGFEHRGIVSRVRGDDVDDREGVGSKQAPKAWKSVDDNGADSASSRNSVQLRRFLGGREAWQGERAPRARIVGRKKKKEHSEKMVGMLKALEENPTIDEALAPWKGLLKENEQGTLLNEQWRCDRALSLFAWLNAQEGYTPNTCHYTIMLKKCGRAQKWELVQKLLSEMQAKNVKLNSYTYNTLIDVYEKAGRKSEATFWFERSRKEGFLDEVSIGSQINVLKEFGDFDEGNRLYESLPLILAQKNSASAKEDPVQMAGLSPRNENAGAVGASNLALEHSEAASELSTLAKKADTYNIVMDLHGKAGDFEKASMTFREMVKAGVKPDIVTYNTMMHICGRAGRVREAKALFKKISEKGLVPDAASYNTLISMFLRRGDKQKALLFFQNMKAAGVAPNAITFHMLLRYSMVSAADVGSGLELTKHIASVMEELSAGIGEPMQDSELAQTIMLNLYKKAEMKELALAAAKRMREGGLPTNVVSFNSVLEMSQSLLEAREIFETMHRKQVIPDTSTYNRMAGALKRVGSLYEALQVIEDADSAGLPLNLHILTTAASLYSHVGMHEEALEACSAMRNCGFPLDAPAFNAMMYAFGNAGRVDEAVRISMEMQTKGVEADVVTHTTVITVYAKMGLIEGVSRVYKRMKKAQCEPDEITYRQLIHVYKNAGREDLAAMVFQERQFARYLARQYRDELAAELSSTEETAEEEPQAEAETAESAES